MSAEGYTRSAEDKTGSVSERIARLRQSLSGDKLSGMAGSGVSAPSLSGLKKSVRRAGEAAEDAFGTPAGYADLGGDETLSAVDAIERKMDKRHERKAEKVGAGYRKNRGGIGEIRGEEKKEPEPVATTNGYATMDDGLPPPTEESRATRLRREGTQFFRRASRAVASAADKIASSRSQTKAADPVDEAACSGFGRVAAADYVDKKQLDQFDRTSFVSSANAVASQIAAATTLSAASNHSGGLWALKARYIATQKVIPKKLAAAKEAEIRANQLADTLSEATDRCNALQAQEALLRALLDQAHRLDGTSSSADEAGSASPTTASPTSSPPKA